MSLLFTIVLAWLASLAVGMMTLLATGEGPREAAGLAEAWLFGAIFVVLALVIALGPRARTTGPAA